MGESIFNTDPEMKERVGEKLGQWFLNNESVKRQLQSRFSKV